MGTLVLSFVTLTLCAQNQGYDWVQALESGDKTFYEIQEEFNKQWDGQTPGKGQGYKQFKRWEHHVAPRVYPSGDLSLLNNTYPNYKKYLKNLPVKAKSGHAWSELGPSLVPSSGGGAGRLTFVRFHPNNQNIIYVGTPNGGLWKTIDGGQNWTNSNDFLSVIGCSDLLIHPTNPDIMYLATGDNDHWSSYSIGVLKSTDAGLTWNSTGMAFDVTQNVRISKMEFDPSNPEVIVAATSSGIRRTEDGGATWSIRLFGNFKDLEWPKGNTDVVYCFSNSYKRSDDGGITWLTISNGLPANGHSRLAGAITPDADSILYILAAKGDYSLGGIYKSTDYGASFVQVTDDQVNMLNGSADGIGGGGQSWYDLAIAVSPNDEDIVWVGGINVWRTDDAGANWTIKSHWYGAQGIPYVHADIHTLDYSPDGSVFYIGNDGGLFTSLNEGQQFLDLSDGLNISQQYRISQGATLSHLIAGHQDNGTNMYNGVSWERVAGGDGMDCLYDRNNSNRIFAAYQNGTHLRSTNGGANFSQILQGLGGGLWVSPVHQHPTEMNTFFFGGRSDLIKTTDGGNTYDEIPTGFAGDIVEFAISESAPDVMYVIQGSRFLRTRDGGASFENKSSGMSSGAAKEWVAIDPNKPDHVWVVMSGYTANAKVYMSKNGGDNWTNISAGLPNVPYNTLLVQNGTDQNVYLGGDVGVFFRDSLTNSWELYNEALPTVTVTDLEFHYPTNTLRAGTYGRGVWEVSAKNESAYASVKELANLSFEIFPNPASTSVTIRGEKTFTKVMMYDASGRFVPTITKVNSVNEWVLLWSNLSPGIYQIKISTNQGEVIRSVQVK
jgi:photosystem II stability/assembly factor-like uncharacterized protein